MSVQATNVGETDVAAPTRDLGFFMHIDVVPVLDGARRYFAALLTGVGHHRMDGSMMFIPGCYIAESRQAVFHLTFI